MRKGFGEGFEDLGCFEERAWPAVTEEEGDGIASFAALVEEVDV